MLTTIHPGRYTAVSDRDFVVFLIGMRANAFDHVRVDQVRSYARQRVTEGQR